MLVALTNVDVAFIGGVAAVVGAAGGLFAGLNAFWQAPKARDHERELARDARLHEELRSSYAAYLEAGYAIQASINEARPRPHVKAHGVPTALSAFLESDPIPAWRHAAARASTVASEEVATAMDTAAERSRAFWQELSRVEHTPDEERNTDALEAARLAFKASIDSLEKLMRADVRK